MWAGFTRHMGDAYHVVVVLFSMSYGDLLCNVCVRQEILGIRQSKVTPRVGFGKLCSCSRHPSPSPIKPDMIDATILTLLQAPTITSLPQDCITLSSSVLLHPLPHPSPIHPLRSQRHHHPLQKSFAPRLIQSHCHHPRDGVAGRPFGSQILS